MTKVAQNIQRKGCCIEPATAANIQAETPYSNSATTSAQTAGVDNTRRYSTTYTHSYEVETLHGWLQRNNSHRREVPVQPRSGDMTMTRSGRLSKTPERLDL